LAHGWALGEVCPRQMPSHGGKMVRSPAFALNLQSRDPAAFVREAEDGAVRLVGRYVPRTEGQRSWDIRGSNDRLNRVFELNQLPYDGYPGQDDADRRGKKPVVETGDVPTPAAAPSSKKRKLGTAMGGLGVSDGFSRELMRTCAAPGGRMSSPELQESSARMLRVTGGWWPRNVPIPRAAGEDFFTSRMVREWRVFPYRRNIAAVVSAVMDKDRQGAAQKRQAVVRLHEARPKRQRGGCEGCAPPAEASRRWRRSRASLHLARRWRQRQAPVVPNRRRLCRRPVGCRRSRRRPECCRRQASASPTSPLILVWTTILVVIRWLVFFNSLIRRRVGRRPTCYSCACRGDHGGCCSAEGEGRGS
jgi:hypothetical protein